MTLTVRKFPSIDRLNALLQARIIGGNSLLRGVGGSPPQLFLNGLTLIFTTPAKTVTFSSAGNQVPLAMQDVKTQIEAVGGLKAGFIDGCLAVWANPAGTIALSHTGTANAFFGFDVVTDTQQKIVNAPGGASPVFVSIMPEVASNQILLVTDE